MRVKIFSAGEAAGGAVNVVASEKGWKEIRPAIAACDVIVDALLGTGLRGPATGLLAAAISGVNEISKNATAARPGFILAVDMPSGLPSDGERRRRPGVAGAQDCDVYRAKDRTTRQPRCGGHWNPGSAANWLAFNAG